jgi:uncharacterized membrane protein
MAMAGYAGRVKRDIARWRDIGLIDEPTAEALSRDVERNAGRGISFGSVLAMMAAALLGAAILIFIAANWPMFPRILRVVTLFAIILAGYVGGALLRMRGRDGFAEAVWMVAAVAFGASISLIAQMYHLSGDEKQAMLVWFGGVAFAALALRSGPLTIGAVLLSVVWMSMYGFSRWDFSQVPIGFLPLAAILWALSFWTGSRAARHLIVLSLYFFFWLLYIASEHHLIPAAIAIAAVGLFAVDHLRPAETARFLGLGSGLPVLALIGFLAGIGMLQISFIDEQHFLWVSIIAMAGIVAALLLAGRSNAMLRWLAYAAFTFQLGFIYVVMLGSMLGTAGFFLVVGAALAVLAMVITRLERRFAAATAEGGA